MKRTFGAPVPYDAASYIEELEAEVDRRLPWNPDCQEDHPIHDPIPDGPSEGDELFCDSCGHPVDMVWVHVFELPIDSDEKIVSSDSAPFYSGYEQGEG